MTTGLDLPAAQPGRAARAAILAVCSVSLFMIAVDTTMVYLALPLIGHGLHTPVAGLQWTITAYTIATASLLLTAGSLGDRFGRRLVFQAGLGIFTLASVGCSLAPSAAWLIAFRVLQGAGGAALTPMSLGIITATFTAPAARARAIGLWTGTFGAGMAAGPVIGGALAATLGWRSVFWTVVPPGVIAIVMAALFIPESRSARARRLDPPGLVLVSIFLACLVYGIIQGPSMGWQSAPVVAAFAAAALALGGLLACERRCAEPLIEFRVFRSVPFAGTLVITLCSFAALGGFLFLTTLYLQDVRSMNVLQAGLWLLPVAVGAVAAPPLAGRVLARHGGRWPLVAGGAALAIGCLALIPTPHALAWLVLIVSFAIFGAGYGAINTVISAVAVAGMPKAQAGVAGGISSAGRQAGQSLGVSLTGAILVIGLHGTVRTDFAAASGWAWILNALCGIVVVLLGLVTTSRRAVRTAARVTDPVSLPVAAVAAGPGKRLRSGDDPDDDHAGADDHAQPDDQAQSRSHVQPDDHMHTEEHAQLSDHDRHADHPVPGDHDRPAARAQPGDHDRPDGHGGPGDHVGLRDHARPVPFADEQPTEPIDLIEERV